MTSEDTDVKEKLDQTKKRVRAYYEANKEAIKLRSRIRYNQNKETHSHQCKVWRERNKDKVSDYRDKWLKENPSYDMYHNAKRRAKEYGIPFDITYKDIEIPEVCPILKIPMVRGVGKSSEFSPSLDRIIPELGYVKGNIAVISSRANRLKNDSSIEELEALLDYMKSKLR